MKTWTWEATADGYAATDGRARLVRTGKKWALVLADGRSFPMPRRPTFDHAERAMILAGVA